MRQRRDMVESGACTDLDTDAVGIGEEDSAGGHARHVGEDLVVDQWNTERLQVLDRGVDVIRSRDIECEVVKA